MHCHQPSVNPSSLVGVGSAWVTVRQTVYWRATPQPPPTPCQWQWQLPTTNHHQSYLLLMTYIRWKQPTSTAVSSKENIWVWNIENYFSWCVTVGWWSRGRVVLIAAADIVSAARAESSHRDRETASSAVHGPSQYHSSPVTQHHDNVKRERVSSLDMVSMSPHSQYKLSSYSLHSSFSATLS